MNTQSGHDVAISFLAKDEPIAKQVAGRLEEGLRVFFFPHNQEELAGTNGLESMRIPFLDSRVVVVLFREPWGQTPWTRVEETAIGERSLKHGWSSLMFVQLDKTSTLPKWLPNTHIRFSFEDYGIDQLVGAIKLRVQEQGGVIEPLDAMGEAKRVQREAEYLADRQSLMRDRRWIEDKVHRSLRETMTEIVKLVDNVNQQINLRIERGARDMTCVLRAGYISLGVFWHQSLYNQVSDYENYKCYLRVASFSGTLTLPSERGYAINQPRLLKEHQFRVEVAQDRGLVWVESGRPEHISPSRLADHIVRLFLDLLARANRGEIEQPTW